MHITMSTPMVSVRMVLLSLRCDNSISVREFWDLGCIARARAGQDPVPTYPPEWPFASRPGGVPDQAVCCHLRWVCREGHRQSASHLQCPAVLAAKTACRSRPDAALA